MKRIILKIRTRAFRNIHAIIYLLSIVVIFFIIVYIRESHRQSFGIRNVEEDANNQFSSEDDVNIHKFNFSEDSNQTALEIVEQQQQHQQLIKKSFLTSMKDYYSQICSDAKFNNRKNVTIDEILFQFNRKVHCPKNVFAIFLVKSDINHFKLREKIRQSWSSICRYQKYRLATLFFTYSSKQLSEKQRDNLKIETEQYWDTVYIPMSFNRKSEVDFYLQLLKFSILSCVEPEYFVLINDDTFVNIPTLLETILAHKDINKKSQKKSLLLCRLIENSMPNRDTKSKWYASAEAWSDHYYPTYCDFPNGVIMSQEVAQDIFFCSLYRKKFWIMDVFLTGILPKILSITVDPFFEGLSNLYMKNHQIFEDLSRNVFLINGSHFSDRTWRLLFTRTMKQF